MVNFKEWYNQYHSRSLSMGDILSFQEFMDSGVLHVQVSYV